MFPGIHVKIVQLSAALLLAIVNPASLAIAHCLTARYSAQGCSRWLRTGLLVAPSISNARAPWPRGNPVQASVFITAGGEKILGACSDLA
ncbi:hypothetical protein K438DRAFT_1854800 [Mycena galopus ATCC 62051]|nr:hypothetical protein K438DRAFT_1854800 [Mycena galopus ATCC 62051]